MKDDEPLIHKTVFSADWKLRHEKQRLADLKQTQSYNYSENNYLWIRARQAGNLSRNVERVREYTAAMAAKDRAECPWKALIVAARSRAKVKDYHSNLTFAWGKARWTGHCELTGLPFLTKPSHSSPFCASLDRIEPAKGYTQDNCRFVLMGVNGLKRGGTDAEMLRIAIALVVQAMPEDEDDA